MLRLFIWAALSILSGTATAVLLVVRRTHSPLLKHFALQMAGWGIAVALFAGAWWPGIALRDVSGATRLVRWIWLSSGFDLGLVVVGATVAALGYRLARSAASLGAGAAIAVQALALLLLDLHFAALISR